jgi:hypothetical protein
MEIVIKYEQAKPPTKEFNGNFLPRTLKRLHLNGLDIVPGTLPESLEELFLHHYHHSESLRPGTLPSNLKILHLHKYF